MPTSWLSGDIFLAASLLKTHPLKESLIRIPHFHLTRVYIPTPYFKAEKCLRARGIKIFEEKEQQT